MIKRLAVACSTVLVLSGLTGPASAQSTAIPACQLVSSAELSKITGRRSYTAGGGTQSVGTSQCWHDVAVWVTLFSGPNAKNQYEAAGTDIKGKALPREAVAGIGDSAYQTVYPGEATEGQKALLVVRQGMHTVVFSINVLDGQKPAALQTQLLAMAKLALPRLPK